MSGALSGVVGGALATMVGSVVSMEALLFAAIDEQQSNTDCAQAVVESIADQFWDQEVPAPRDAEDGDFSMSVAEIADLLTSHDVVNGGFWMSWDDLPSVLGRYGPAIVHFDHPTGHYAVAVGAVAPRHRFMLVADPARGTVIVSDRWWQRHASGATIVVDTDWDRDERDRLIGDARRRLRRLEVARDDL
ncbi:MAG: cysteine peptidase family C39 domain-containing protein [Alkalispirochaeta sp.]